MAIAVICRPFVRVREDCISLAHFLELVLGIRIIGISIRMELQGKLPIGTLQFLFGNRAGYAQDLVVIAFCVRGQKIGLSTQKNRLACALELFCMGAFALAAGIPSGAKARKCHQRIHRHDRISSINPSSLRPSPWRAAEAGP